MENFIKLIEQCIYSDDVQKMASDFRFIQEVINFILRQIKKTNTMNDAAIAFSLLEEIQFVLAKAVFKDKIIVTVPLDKFITDFDRIDDEEVRAFFYLKIKSDEYML